MVKLLNDRTKLALEIGKLKHESGGEIYAPDREEAVLQRVAAKNTGPISEESLRAGSLRVSGRLGKAFWPLVVGAGVILPAVLILWQPGATIVSAAAAAAALFGLWIYEHLWIKAGQAMPLS